MIRLTVAGDDDAAARMCAERIAAAIQDARAQRGVAHIALAGGRTPVRTYQLLARLVDDWSDVHLWLGDERCVPLDDPDSNHALVAGTLLADVQGTPPELHPVTGAETQAAAAAAAYERELRDALPGDPPLLDVAYLGLGEDGHTASLFAGDPVLEERDRLCVPVHGTRPPFERVTLTLPILRSARRILMQVEGSGKAWAVGAMLAGPTPRIPASLLADGDVELVVDRSAAPS